MKISLLSFTVTPSSPSPSSFLAAWSLLIVIPSYFSFQTPYTLTTCCSFSSSIIQALFTVITLQLHKSPNWPWAPSCCPSACLLWCLRFPPYRAHLPWSIISINSLQTPLTPLPPYLPLPCFPDKALTRIHSGPHLRCACSQAAKHC